MIETSGDPSSNPTNPLRRVETTTPNDSLAREEAGADSTPMGGGAVKGPKPVERLFPFAVRSGILLPGRDIIARSRSKLHFVLITTDVSENTKHAILQDFRHYPIIQRYVSSDLEKFFHVRGAKVLGFRKSTLSQSIYAELKDFRIQKAQVDSPEEAKARKNAARQRHLRHPGGG